MLTKFGVHGVFISPCGARDKDRKRGVLSISGDNVRNERARRGALD